MPEQNHRPSQASKRRESVKDSASMAALGCSALETTAQTVSLIRPGDTILFQGDSISDAERDRETAGQPNRQAPLGDGFAWLAAASMLVHRPDDELRIFNRGISGHKVPQLADRWQEDCLDIRPDVLNLLIGVNDLWHLLDGHYDGTVEVYESGFHALVERTQEALPEVRLVICEPFVLRCGVIDEKWFPAFNEYRAVAKRVSDTAGATYVPFQSMFDRAIEFAPPNHWAADGVHPTSAGAALMAHCWLRTVRALRTD